MSQRKVNVKSRERVPARHNPNGSCAASAELANHLYRKWIEDVRAHAAGRAVDVLAGVAAAELLKRSLIEATEKGYLASETPEAIEAFHSDLEHLLTHFERVKDGSS